ncbi:class I SAM-dependent methyltransferase [Streptomyces mutabilis]|uniref:class I SAM-dependent methyltransferase n=1 Tax=Streptomyces mutabilis TaxID=67332 RepID=UPI000A21A205|nr:class I SAM-dependent methyltransferase [Streptomyces sp. Alain-F2R5]MDG9689180.1 class I SAM-dependent methyltransferase [Streptomyces sp. DH17]OSC71629.1 SAM-dependent methyltransferase [Streptomyces sp. 4F]PAM98026.1 SAM-dependent methyltransferase [Streptomyces sp. Alain-F2R5]
MTDTPATAPAAEFWEARYRDTDRVWSGRPNDLLVREASDLAPGTALDLGCGEGADAVWLASRGWRVTGVDISGTALERAAGHAAEAGVGDRVVWERHELGRSFPEGSFDLVSAQFLQSPVELDQRAVLRDAARAVADGGTLLLVLHAGWPSWQTQPPFDAVFPTLDGVLAELALPDGEWAIETKETVRRPSVSPEGVEGFREDHVWRLRRV